MSEEKLKKYNVGILGATGAVGQEMVKVLENIKADKKALIVMDEKDDNVVRSASNIPGVRTALVSTMNVYEIVNHYTLVLTKAAAKKIEEVYA